MKNCSLIFLTFLVVSSCKTANTTGTTNTDQNESINYIVQYINEKIDVSNQINIDNKSQYDPEANVLIIFIGSTADNYFQKWELPIHDLDPESVSIDLREFSGNRLTVTTKENQNKIKYYKDGELKSMTSEFNYYLGANATKREINRFTKAFRQAVSLNSRE